LDERDPRRPVGIVLDGDDLPLDPVLVTLPVDDPVPPLVAATDVARGDVAVVVAAAGLAQRNGQAALGLLALGQLRVIRRGHEPTARARRLVVLETHDSLPSDPEVEEVDRLPFLEHDDRLLPIGPTADEPADALVLPADDLGTDVHDVDAEEPLDRRLDVVLGRPAIHLEGVGAVLVTGPLALLGEDGAPDHVFEPQDSTPSRCRAAAVVRTRCGRRSAASTLKPSTGRASNSARFRIDLIATSRSRSSGPPATTTRAEG